MDRNEELKKNYMGQSCGMKSDKSDNVKNQDINSQSSSKYSSDSSGIAGSGPVSTMNDSVDKSDYKSQYGSESSDKQSSSQSSQMKESQSNQMKGGCGCGDDGIGYTETVFIIEEDPTDM